MVTASHKHSMAYGTSYSHHHLVHEYPQPTSIYTSNNSKARALPVPSQPAETGVTHLSAYPIPPTTELVCEIGASVPCVQPGIALQCG